MSCYSIRIIEASPVVPYGYELMQPAYAQEDPSIRYRGFEMSLRQYAPKPTLSDSGLRGDVITSPELTEPLLFGNLIPLEVAQKCRRITHRREGFEMLETKNLIDKMRRWSRKCE